MKYLLSVFLSVLCISVLSHADPRMWDPQGLAIRAGEHVTWEQTYARSEDGTTLIVWTDARNGNYDVFAQAFNGNLDSLYSVAVCTHPSSQKNLAVCAVTDGWIVAWTDNRTGGSSWGDQDFCVQKLDAQGNLLWNPDGVLIVSGDMQRSIYGLSPGSDGNGGAIIAFSRHISTCSDVFAQRIDQNGQIVWPDLIGVADIPDCSQDLDGVVSDVNGDLLVAWGDCRGFYGARITPDGQMPWGANGRRLSGLSPNYNRITMVYDDAGGFYLGWTASAHTYAQHIGSDGSCLWDSAGVRVCTDDLHSQTESAMAPSWNNDQMDGLVFAWRDTRFGQYYDRHIFAQKLDLNGIREWADDGVRISLNLDNITPSVQSDGAGGAVVGWLREEEDQAAQRLDASGVPQWTTFGVDVTTGTARQERSIMLRGEDGNVAMLWPDATGTSGGIRAQRLQLLDGARILGEGGRPVVFGLDGWGDMPQAVTLGGGRVGFVWSDRRGYKSPLIYYQIANTEGQLERALNGEPVTPGMPNSTFLMQAAPCVCPDDSGGFFVIFDERFTWGEYRIRLAHGGGDGEVLTPPDGRLIDPGNYYGERFPKVVPDRVGGCYVVYYTFGTIVMQRYNRVGLPVWNQFIVSPSNWPSVSDVVSANGTCTIAYRTGENSRGIISCIDSSRNLRWQEELSGPPTYAYLLKIASDRNGGIYAVWSIDADSSSDHQFDLYAQRFDSTGAWMWGQYGVAVYAGPGDQYGSSIAVAPSGELYVAWADSRDDPDVYDIYAQRFSPEGEYLWPENGLFLVPGENLNYQWPSSIGVDSTGGLLVTWRDGPDVMGAHVNASGQWNQDPYWIPEQGGWIGGPAADPAYSMADDGLGGWVLAWSDQRLIVDPYDDNSSRAIFAQRIVDSPLIAGKHRAPAPGSFSLGQNYPNPFNPSTVFELAVPVTSHVTLEAFDILGRHVETLADHVFTAGTHRLTWNCEACASGTYLIVMSAPHTRIVREAVLLR